MWMLEDRYGNVYAMPVEIKKEYRELQHEYNLVRKKLNYIVSNEK